MAGANGTILKTIEDGITLVEEKISVNFNINIYPNPANYKIIISHNRDLPEEAVLSIYEINGKLLMLNKFENQKLIEIDVSTISKGIYLVKIQTKEGMEVKKLVIQ